MIVYCCCSILSIAICYIYYSKSYISKLNTFISTGSNVSSNLILFLKGQYLIIFTKVFIMYLTYHGVTGQYELLAFVNIKLLIQNLDMRILSYYTVILYIEMLITYWIVSQPYVSIAVIYKRFFAFKLCDFLSKTSHKPLFLGLFFCLVFHFSASNRADILTVSCLNTSILLFGIFQRHKIHISNTTTLKVSVYVPSE